jgi:hypothetical protein
MQVWAGRPGSEGGMKEGAAQLNEDVIFPGASEWMDAILDEAIHIQ